MTRRANLAAALLALLLLWLVGWPLLVTLAEALGTPRWTLSHFSNFVRRPEEWRALWASLWISLATVGLSAAIGVPLAFLFERSGPRRCRVAGCRGGLKRSPEGLGSGREVGEPAPFAVRWDAHPVVLDRHMDVAEFGGDSELDA